MAAPKRLGLDRERDETRSHRTERRETQGREGVSETSEARERGRLDRPCRCLLGPSSQSAGILRLGPGLPCSLLEASVHDELPGTCGPAADPQDRAGWGRVSRLDERREGTLVASGLGQVATQVEP